MSSQPSEAEQRLERLMHQALRELPMRAAPPTLESRVLGELKRRASLPWWRRSFRCWPKGARAAFTSLCIVLAGMGFAGGTFVLASARSLNWDPSAMLAVRETAKLVAVMRELVSSLMRAVPAHWIYGGLAVSAALYVALFGLGIAAYHTLYLNSTLAGERT
jgi:hypothetical protein